MKLRILLNSKRHAVEPAEPEPAAKQRRVLTANVVRLNVSGRPMVTSRAVLESEPEFVCWLRQRDGDALERGYPIAMDGDSQAMTYALAFFSAGKLPPSAAQPLQRFRLLGLTRSTPMPRLRAAVKAMPEVSREFMFNPLPRPAPPPLPSETLVSVCVGGVRQVVQPTVLARQGGTLAMLCQREAASLAEGTLRLDADGTTFGLAYGFVRDGALPPPPALNDTLRWRLSALAKQWCLDSLLREMKIILPLRDAVWANPADPAPYLSLSDALNESGRTQEADAVRGRARALQGVARTEVPRYLPAAHLHTL